MCESSYLTMCYLLNIIMSRRDLVPNFALENEVGSKNEGLILCM